MSKPLVAVVGRPNVGKSTFFNRIVGRRVSIVEDTPGVTRDRIYAEAEWSGIHFGLIDTGGIEPDSDDIILSQMREQAQVAMDINGNEIRFVSPKAYAALDDVHGFFTLTPESDFIMIGNYGEADAVDDDDYDEGLYHALNDDHDGVYMITGATWYSLLPHFEIGGK